MQSITIRFSRLFLVLVAVACSMPALATYNIVVVDYPGATDTQVFGINNQGEAVGTAYLADGSVVPFDYDSKSGVLTPQAPVPGKDTSAVGISESGVIVGSAVDGDGGTAFIRSNKGAYTLFSHPGWSETTARAVNNSGTVTGYAFDGNNTYVGFIYDPTCNTFIDVLPSPRTVAQGINNRGAVVGSVNLPAGTVCATCGKGNYGWLRAPNGTITLFRVNGQPTWARGLSDKGLITGFAYDPATGALHGFVIAISGSGGYETPSVPALLVVPGAAITNPQAITNAGVVAGSWVDADGALHGFIATP